MLISQSKSFDAKDIAIEKSHDLERIKYLLQTKSMKMDDIIEGGFQASHKGKQSIQENKKKLNYKISGDLKEKNTQI